MISAHGFLFAQNRIRNKEAGRRYAHFLKPET